MLEGIIENGRLTILAPSSPTSVGTQAIVNRTMKLVFVITISAVTAGLDSFSCSAGVSVNPGDSNFSDSGNANATLISGTTYRCRIELNVRWNGVDTLEPLRPSISVSGSGGGKSHYHSSYPPAFALPANGSTTTTNVTVTM